MDQHTPPTISGFPFLFFSLIIFLFRPFATFVTNKFIFSILFVRDQAQPLWFPNRTSSPYQPFFPSSSVTFPPLVFSPCPRNLSDIGGHPRTLLPVDFFFEVRFFSRSFPHPFQRIIWMAALRKMFSSTECPGLGIAQICFPLASFFPFLQRFFCLDLSTRLFLEDKTPRQSPVFSFPLMLHFCNFFLFAWVRRLPVTFPPQPCASGSLSVLKLDMAHIFPYQFPSPWLAALPPVLMPSLRA